jgi:hypothetical protein
VVPAVGEIGAQSTRARWVKSFESKHRVGEIIIQFQPAAARQHSTGHTDGALHEKCTNPQIAAWQDNNLSVLAGGVLPAGQRARMAIGKAATASM